MKTALFTKLFGSRPVDAIGSVAAEIGFDGIDLLIRPGFSAAPDEPASIRMNTDRLSAFGLPVLMATTDLTDPERYPTEVVLSSCAEAGITTVRLGYWHYDASRPYREILSSARRDLDALESVAERLGMTLLVQLHGGTIHSSGSLATRLLEDRNPQLIGSYVDPGNQFVQDGREDWRLTFDVLGERMRCVGVKNGGWFPASIARSGQRRWFSDWLGVADGAVPWDEIIAHLRSAEFDGVLSFHGHYELPFDHVIDQTRTDLAYIRRLLRDDT